MMQVKVGLSFQVYLKFSCEQKFFRNARIVLYFQTDLKMFIKQQVTKNALLLL